MPLVSSSSVRTCFPSGPKPCWALVFLSSWCGNAKDLRRQIWVTKILYIYIYMYVCIYIYIYSWHLGNYVEKGRKNQGILQLIHHFMLWVLWAADLSSRVLGATKVPNQSAWTREELPKMRGSPSHHRFRCSNGRMTWMIWGYPYFGKPANSAS